MKKIVPYLIDASIILLSGIKLLIHKEKGEESEYEYDRQDGFYR